MNHIFEIFIRTTINDDAIKSNHNEYFYNIEIQLFHNDYLLFDFIVCLPEIENNFKCVHYAENSKISEEYFTFDLENISYIDEIIDIIKNKIIHHEDYINLYEEDLEKLNFLYDYLTTMKLNNSVKRKSLDDIIKQFMELIETQEISIICLKNKDLYVEVFHSTELNLLKNEHEEKITHFFYTKDNKIIISVPEDIYSLLTYYDLTCIFKNIKDNLYIDMLNTIIENQYYENQTEKDIIIKKILSFL